MAWPELLDARRAEDQPLPLSTPGTLVNTHAYTHTSTATPCQPAGGLSRLLAWMQSGSFRHEPVLNPYFLSLPSTP